jgi:hypothetical protein
MHATLLLPLQLLHADQLPLPYKNLKDSSLFFGKSVAAVLLKSHRHRLAEAKRWPQVAVAKRQFQAADAKLLLWQNRLQLLHRHLKWFIRSPQRLLRQIVVVV